MASKKAVLTERFLPTLVLISVVLAFVVGVLWQRVSDLEGGTTRTTGTTAGSAGAGAALPAGTSPLQDLPAVADQIGVDKGDFEKCVASSKYDDKVESQYQTGIAAGITGTPGSFVVNKNGEAWLMAGALPIDNVKAVIDDALGTGTGTAAGKLDSATTATISPVSADDHIRGSLDADVYVIEYSDFECPFCQRFHPTMVQAFDEYNGKIAWVYRHFPLDQIHPLARPAAIASECITELGGDEAFWDFADVVFGG